MNFIYKNAKNTSTSYIFSKLNFGYYLYTLYKKFINVYIK